MGEFRGNWIGEPSSVMIKRECFNRVGLFSPRLRQICDLEMWLRILFFHDVGFVADALRRSDFTLIQPRMPTSP